MPNLEAEGVNETDEKALLTFKRRSDKMEKNIKEGYKRVKTKIKELLTNRQLTRGQGPALDVLSMKIMILYRIYGVDHRLSYL